MLFEAELVEILRQLQFAAALGPLAKTDVFARQRHRVERIGFQGQEFDLPPRTDLATDCLETALKLGDQPALADFLPL